MVEVSNGSLNAGGLCDGVLGNGTNLLFGHKVKPVGADGDDETRATTREREGRRVHCGEDHVAERLI
jgi:hypothetical protein